MLVVMCKKILIMRFKGKRKKKEIFSIIFKCYLSFIECFF